MKRAAYLAASLSLTAAAASLAVKVDAVAPALQGRERRLGQPQVDRLGHAEQPDDALGRGLQDALPERPDRDRGQGLVDRAAGADRGHRARSAR